MFFIPLQMMGIDLQLFPGLLIPFIITTLVITICGYLINDYFDFESDLTNDKRHKLKNPSSYLYLYLIFFVAGFLLAFYIAQVIGRPLLSLIYMGASVLLFLYSSHFKKRPLMGNIIVSIFTSFVLLILAYAEWPSYQEFLLKHPDKYHKFITLIISYSVFAFLITMVREIVKDMEDVDGDRQAGYNTLAIALGNEKTKIITMFFGIILILSMGIWSSKMLFQAPIYLWGIFILLCIRLVYMIYKINKATNSNTLHSASSGLKWTMIMGLAFLIIYYQWI